MRGGRMINCVPFFIILFSCGLIFSFIIVEFNLISLKIQKETKNSKGHIEFESMLTKFHFQICMF